jgi:hypothetical protein
VKTDEREQRRLEAAGWPPALLKACMDAPWIYAAGLRDGSVVVFTGAEASPDGQWATLDEARFATRRREGEQGGHGPIHGSSSTEPGDNYCGRGLEVRVADIVWAADAPWGS